jgi:hypothetical protein
MHLHGHDFAVLAQTENAYDATNFTLNINNPPRRDVVLLPAKGHVIIAFKSDNPGTWLLHCHIARHASEGLALQILEDKNLASLMWPRHCTEPICGPQNNSDKLCAAWKRWVDECHYNSCEKWFQDDSGI